MATRRSWFPLKLNRKVQIQLFICQYVLRHLKMQICGKWFTSPTDSSGKAAEMPRPIEFDQTFAFLVKVLRLIGYPSFLIPDPDNLAGKLKSNAPFIVCFLMLASCVLGLTINIIRLMTGARQTDEVVEEVAIQISSTGFCIIGLIKMYSLAYNRNILTSLIGDFRDKWNDKDLTPPDRKIRDGTLRPTVTITTIAAIGNILMVNMFNFLPVAEMIYTRVTKGQWNAVLPYRIWYPFEATRGSKYYLVYLFEVYSGIIVAAGNVGFNSIFCLLASHLTMQLKLLRNWVENMVEIQDKRSLERSKEQFCRVVQYHQDVLRYRDVLQTMFSTTLFLNFSASSVLMCLQGYLITTASITLVFKFTLFMLCVLTEIFLLCYYGEEISENSKEIASGAYNCNWYHGEVTGRDPRFGKNLIPIIQRGQIPMILTAWKFWPITIQTFSMILQTSWSYFTLLKTVMP